MNVVRARRLVFCFLAVLLLFSVTVSAAPTSDDGIVSGLLSGWSSTYAPTYYTSSWFWQMLVELRDIDNTLISNFDGLKNGWTGSTLSTPSGYSNSWFGAVRNLLYGVDGKLDLIQPDVGTIKSNTSLIETYSGTIKTYVSTYVPDILDQLADINSDADHLSFINDSTSSISTSAAAIDLDLDAVKRSLASIDALSASIDESTNSLNVNLGTLFHYIWEWNEDSWFSRMFLDIHDLHEIYASEDDLELKQSQVEEQEAFISGFGSVDRAGDISDMSGLRSGLTDWFSLPDVDISSTFEQVESGYSSWFSSETAQALTVGAGASAFSGVSLMDDTYVEPDTPYLDDYDRQVQDILAGGDGEW